MNWVIKMSALCRSSSKSITRIEKKYTILLGLYRLWLRSAYSYYVITVYCNNLKVFMHDQHSILFFRPNGQAFSIWYKSSAVVVR